MHVGNTDTARTLDGMHLIAGNAATVVNILSKNRVAGIGSHISHIVAINQHIVLVNNADSCIHLITECAILDDIAYRTDIRCRTSDIGADNTAVESTVGHRHRVTLTSVQQCLTRGSDGVTVGEHTVLKHTIGTVVAQLNYDIATVV